MYRLPQFDIGWQKYADLFRLERNDKDRDAFDNIPPEIFASKAYGPIRSIWCRRCGIMRN